MSSIFGGGKSKTTVVEQASSVPVTYSGPRSLGVNVNGAEKFGVNFGANGKATTSIGTNPYMEQTKGMLGNQYIQQRNRVGGIITSLQGPQNDFINARVRPLEQRVADTVADQSRELERRGVFGSLANNELNKTRFEGQREIGDARATATNEALNALMSAEGLLRGVNSDDLQFAGAMVTDELARLGLSMEAIQLALGDQKQTSQVAGGSSTKTEKAPTDILGGLGKIATIGTALSDRRLKRDIDKIGNAYGFPLYSFKYLWSEDIQVGFMADEVETLVPEAVAYVNGYAIVNYAKVRAYEHHR